MKKLLLSTLFCMCFFCNIMQAQTGTNVIGHQRGIYVDDFINLIPSSIDPDENIDISNSILGNILREDELLKYCMENHITYLTLYNMRSIFIKPASPQ